MDSFLREVGYRVVRAWRAQLAASVGSSPVVGARVIGQHGPQVPRAGDQHPVGYLGPDGEHETLREGVRPGAARRDLHYFDAGCGQDRVDLQVPQDPAEVDALIRWPSLSSSPWIRWYPQEGFSVASLPMSMVISVLTGCRPARFG